MEPRSVNWHSVQCQSTWGATELLCQSQISQTQKGLRGTSCPCVPWAGRSAGWPPPRRRFTTLDKGRTAPQTARQQPHSGQRSSLKPAARRSCSYCSAMARLPRQCVRHVACVAVDASRTIGLRSASQIVYKTPKAALVCGKGGGGTQVRTRDHFVRQEHPHALSDPC